jgi:hypothetical protein
MNKGLIKLKCVTTIQMTDFHVWSSHSSKIADSWNVLLHSLIIRYVLEKPAMFIFIVTEITWHYIAKDSSDGSSNSSNENLGLIKITLHELIWRVIIIKCYEKYFISLSRNFSVVQCVVTFEILDFIFDSDTAYKVRISWSTWSWNSQL